MKNDMDEKLIDILWLVKQGKLHPNRAYKQISSLIKKTACTLEKSTEDWVECDVTSCCRKGPITNENYCPNCGSEITR